MPLLLELLHDVCGYEEGIARGWLCQMLPVSGPPQWWVDGEPRVQSLPDSSVGLILGRSGCDCAAKCIPQDTTGYARVGD